MKKREADALMAVLEEFDADYYVKRASTCYGVSYSVFALLGNPFKSEDPQQEREHTKKVIDMMTCDGEWDITSIQDFAAVVRY